MSKISALPIVAAPDGSETVVALKNGVAQRVELGKLAAPFVAGASAQADRAETAANRAVASLTITQVLNKLGAPTATSANATLGTFELADVAAGPGPVSFEAWGHAAGAVKLKRTATDAAGTRTVLEERTVVLAAGKSNAFSNSDLGGLRLEEGEKLSFYHTGQIGFSTPASFLGAGVSFVGAGDRATWTTAAANTPNYRFELRVTIEAQIINTGSYQKLVGQSAKIAENTAAIDKLSKSGTTVLGTAPIAPTGGAAPGTFMFADSFEFGGAPKVDIWPWAAGTVYFRRFKRNAETGIDEQQGGDAPVAVAAGVSATIYPALVLEAGERLGCYQASNIIGFTMNAFPQAGISYKSGNNTSMNGPAPNTPGYRYEIRASVTGKTQLVTAAAVQGGIDAAAAASTQSKVLNGWGDSMMFGAGGTSIIAQLAALMSRAYVNNGVSAQRLPDILARFGSHAMRLPLLTIPAAGSVDFTVPGFGATGVGALLQANPITDNNSAAVISGSICGIAGTLTRISGTYPNSYVYRFTRAAAGTAMIVRAGNVFIPTITDNRRNGTNIFWAGRNSLGLQNISGQSFAEQFDAVMKLLERAVRWMLARDPAFVLIPPSNRNDEYPGSTAQPAGAALNGDQAYALLIAVRDEMVARWPRNVALVRERVIASYTPGSGSATDDANFANDIPPAMYRSDFLHYNTAGYGLAAAEVKIVLDRNGY